MRSIIKICKEFNKYKQSEIERWHLVQLEYSKKIQAWKSASLHYYILRKDPTWTWKVVGEWYWEQKGEQALFYMSQIKIDYKINPVYYEKKIQKRKNRI